MKRLAYLSGLFILAVFILLPASNGLNHNISKPAVADGTPLPWPIPPLPPSNATLVADGTPLPWPIPPLPPNNATLVADGTPLPWPIPPQNPLAA